MNIVDSFDQWSGQLTLSHINPDVTTILSDDALFNDLSLTLKFDQKGKKVLLNAFAEKNKKQILHAKGSLDLTQKTFYQSPIDVSINGVFDLSLFASVIAPDQLKGLLNVSLMIKGDLSNIDLSGKVLMQDGLYDNSKNGTHITNIKGRLKGVGKKLIIETLTANDLFKINPKKKNTRVGTIEGDGYLEFIGLNLPFFHIGLKLTDLLVVQRDDMTIRATGNVKMVGQGLQSEISGNVNVSQSLILLEEMTNEDDSPIIIKEFEKEKRRSRPNKPKIFPLNIQLNVDKNFYIRDRDVGLMSQWTGALTVKGDLSDVHDPSNPYLEGTITAIKGKFSFLGKPVKIAEAKIWYDDHVKNKPNIWFVGTRKVDGVNLYLQVSGRVPSTIKYNYVSDPSLPEDEVLSRFLFSKELSKISAGQSAQLASIGASMNSKNGNNLNFLESLRSSLGVDTFELTENQMKAEISESGQTPAQALRIGKEFDNVQISIDQSLGSTGSKATVSTALDNNVYLDLEVGEKYAGSGAGVSWVYRY